MPTAPQSRDAVASSRADGDAAAVPTASWRLRRHGGAAPSHWRRGGTTGPRRADGARPPPSMASGKSVSVTKLNRSRRKCARRTSLSTFLRRAMRHTLLWLLFVVFLSVLHEMRAYPLPLPPDVLLPHRCSSCSRSFKQFSGLQRHNRQDHRGVPFWIARRGSPAGGRARGNGLGQDCGPADDAAGTAEPQLEPAAPVQPVAGPSSSSSSLAAPPNALLQSSVTDQTKVTDALQSVATAERIHEYYRRWGDTQRTRPVVTSIPGGRPSAFVTPVLKMFRSFVLSAGGCGLSVKDKARFWEAVVAGERESLRDSGGLGAMEAAFPTADAFVASLRTDADRCMEELKWRVTDFSMGDNTVHFYSRDLMQVLREAAEGADELAILGRRRRDSSGNVVRSGTIDSDVYLKEQEMVLDMHGRDGMSKVFVMAVQLFSDAALVSWSGGAFTCVCSMQRRCGFFRAGWACWSASFKSASRIYSLTHQYVAVILRACVLSYASLQPITCTLSERASRTWSKASQGGSRWRTFHT